jgi:hypothetical protein
MASVKDSIRLLYIFAPRPRLCFHQNTSKLKRSRPAGQLVGGLWKALRNARPGHLFRIHALAQLYIGNGRGSS